MKLYAVEDDRVHIHSWLLGFGDGSYRRLRWLSHVVTWFWSWGVWVSKRTLTLKGKSLAIGNNIRLLLVNYLYVDFIHAIGFTLNYGWTAFFIICFSCVLMFLWRVIEDWCSDWLLSYAINVPPIDNRHKSVLIGFHFNARQYSSWLICKRTQT